MKPPVVHDDLVSSADALLAPEDSMEIDGSQQQVPNEANEVTLPLKLVLEEALPQEQLQHILGPYSGGAFGCPIPPGNSPPRNWQRRQKRKKLSQSLGIQWPLCDELELSTPESSARIIQAVSSGTPIAETGVL
ncbi:unnamed protein product [Caretta caretta]